MPFGVWVVAGVVVGAAASAAIVASGALDHEPTAPEPVADGAEQRQEAGDDFVAAWERSRLGTYVVESTLQRTFPAGNGFSADRTTAQRPPDRLERSLGSVNARLEGGVVRCRTEQGRYRCTTGRAERSFRALVRDEVETMQSYVAGDVPLYSVEADGECFDLTQILQLPAPPYGTEARFCFDDETGAITYVRVVRDEATDVTEATDVRAEVRDEDLEPPENGDPSEGSAPNIDEG